MTVEERARKIKLLLSDIDGVLTDGKIIYDTFGAEVKSFNVLDGVGLSLTVSNGIKVILISARGSSILRRRARELNVTKLYQNVRDKSAVFQKLLRRLKLSADEVCYMGDDLPDLAPLGAVGLAVAPANAHPWIAERVHWQTRADGGRGAARELCDILLAAQGHVDAVLARFGA